MSEASSSQATKDTSLNVTELANKVNTIETHLAQILSNVQAPRTPSLSAAPNDTTKNNEAVFKISNLSYHRPAPSAEAVSTAASTGQTYAESGKLTLFKKPAQLAHFPSNRFVPASEGLFGRIKTNDTRDSWEAETLWNTGYNLEVSLAALHELATVVSTKDINGAIEATSVLHHYLLAAYQRVQERVDFFTDPFASGKSEAILLQKYLREDYRPFSSELYRDTKKKFVGLRSKAFAKALNEQKTKQNKGKGKNEDKPE